MNIQIKKLVKGVLIGESGYTRIASTAEVPDIFADLDNHGQNLLSPNFASLFAFKAEGKKSLSVVHVQGQHEGDPGRMYDTRNFYSIDAEEIRKCNSKTGNIIGSLPKLKKYENKELGRLNNDLQVEDIKGFDEMTSKNLRGHIMQAIVECKYLLIKLDEKNNWKENGVLENADAKTLFAAMDNLPEMLRPIASFALSVDGKYQKDFLKNFLIILYHGSNDFGFNPTITIEIDWEDIKNKPHAKYSPHDVFYTKLAKLVIGNRTDFFDTEWSSMEILINLLNKSKDPNLRNSVEYLKIQKDWEKLINHSEINATIQAKAEKSGFNLSDLYNFFENNKKAEIRKKYAELYCQIKSALSTGKQIETLKALLNIPTANIERDLQNLLSDKLISQILDKTLSFDEWFDVAEIVSSSKFEQKFIEETAKQDLSFFEKLFKSGKYKEIAEKSFKETSAYKNNLNELCSEPFLSLLPPDKKKLLREKHIDNNQDFRDLYKGITYAEIKALEVRPEQKLRLVKKEDKSKFISDNKEYCEEQFEKAFLNSELNNSEIYKLYSETKVPFPQIDENKISLDNLKNAWENAKVLKINLENTVKQLYKSNSNVNDWSKIYKITGQRTDEKIDKKVETKEGLDNCLYLQDAGFVLPEIAVTKLLTNLTQQTADNADLDALLSKLKKLGVSLAEHKDLIKIKLSTNKRKNVELLRKFSLDDPQEPDLAKPKAHTNTKWLVAVAVIALFIGFVGGYKTHSFVDKPPVASDSIVNADITVAKPQIVETTAINDSITVFYKKNNTKKQLKYNHTQTTEWFKLINIQINSVQINDSVFVIAAKIDGPNSGKQFYQEIDSLINTLK
jgi:hypothetical protein